MQKERIIKVPLIPVEHDLLVQSVDFAKIAEATLGKKLDPKEVSERMQDALKDYIEIRMSGFDKLSDEKWDELRKKVETHLQKFGLALRTAMQLSVESDEYSLRIIAEAVRTIEEEVTFRAVLKLGESKKS